MYLAGLYHFNKFIVGNLNSGSTCHGARKITDTQKRQDRRSDHDDNTLFFGVFTIIIVVPAIAAAAGPPVIPVGIVVIIVDLIIVHFPVVSFLLVWYRACRWQTVTIYIMLNPSRLCLMVRELKPQL